MSNPPSGLSPLFPGGVGQSLEIAAHYCQSQCEDQQPHVRCWTCHERISASPPRPRGGVRLVRCPGCGVPYVADSRTVSSQDTSDAPLQLPTPMKRALHFLQGYGDKSYTGDEQRAAPRYEISAPVTAIPVHEQSQRLGTPIPMLLRNISTAGAALLSDCPTPTTLLALDFSAGGVTDLQILMRVQRTILEGTHFTIAGRFVEDSQEQIDD